MTYLFLFIFQWVSYGALESKYDDFDGFPLVEALVLDNKLSEAQKELEDLHPQDPVLASYWRGVIDYKKEKYEDAKKWFGQASVLKDNPIYNWRSIYLGRVHSALNSPLECAQSYERVLDKNILKSDDVVMWTRCYQKVKNYDKGWALISGALQTHSDFSILEMANVLLAELQLWETSLKISMDWLSRYGVKGSDFLAIADFYGQHKFGDGQLKVLELARLRFPLDVDVQLSLNQVFFEKGLLLAVEEGFARATLIDRKYAYHTAEINRQVGHYERSMYFNGLIPDESEQLKQKLAIYVDKNQFAQIASLESILLRSPLIKDDEVRYALSYSLVKMGEYHRPLKYLAQITQKEFLEKTVILRNALSDCVENKKVCQL